MKLPVFLHFASIHRFYFYAVMIFFGVLYSTISIANHYFFRSTVFDYGPYNFAFWDYAHFHISPCPIYKVFSNVQITFLQDHFSLTLMFLVPFYWLLNWITGTYTLLFIQVAFILWGGWATYRLVKLKTNDEWLGLGAILFYFLLQGRYAAFATDCNIIIICSSFVPVFLFYFESKHFIAATIIFVLSLFSREDMPLWFVFIFIMLIVWHRKEWKIIRICLWYILASVVYFILLFKVFIPLVESPDRHYDLFTYNALGQDPYQALLFIIKHPIDTFTMLFQNQTGNPQNDGIKNEFYLMYLVSGGFMLFFRPQYFIWFIPLIAQKMLNDEPVRWSIESYYAVQVATLLPLSVFLILSNEKSRTRKYFISVVVCSLALLVTIYKMDKRNHAMPWVTTDKMNILDSNFFHPRFNAREIHKNLELIPPDARVSASASILPHLAQRKYIYEFPDVDDAEYIAAFSFHDLYLMTSGEYNSQFYKYVFSPDWRIIANTPPFLLFKKEPRQIKGEKIYETIFCNVETVTPDRQHFIASDNQLLNNTDTRDSLIVHQGKYSVKLTKEKQYGMTFLDKNITAGDILQVSVWKYSVNKHNGYLVASCGADFSQRSSETNGISANGWDKIILYVTVPIDHNGFGIFVWNNEDEPVWFDDLEIIKYKR